DLFFDPKDLCLYGSVESTQGEGASNKLLASKPLGKNEVVCQTTPKGTGTQVVLGDNQKVSVVIDKSLQADKIAIDKAGIYVDKDKLKEFANTKMNAKVKEIDVLGDRSVLYLQLEGVLCSGRPAEVVAVVDGVMTYGKDERIKIAINPASIG
ncbi:MAG: hypothetical protein FWD76_06360, partial [Firmicutes bacterium]|nr:hypothetical protein [Bacillota bacterium]